MLSYKVVFFRKIMNKCIIFSNSKKIIGKRIVISILTKVIMIIIIIMIT